MKKRLLSALLALALVFVLLPTTALAGETTGKDYDISINGKGWKFEKDTPVYFYGYDPSNYFFSTTADHQWTTNSNLMLTKEGNTVTITIRPSKYHPYESPQFTLKKESTSTEKNDVPCIEMGNGNNLVITGKGTLNITRDEKNGIGAALCSEVGDITITDGITVKANFLKQVSKSTVGNAISVKDHNLIISGKNTKVEARNSSCNFQDLYDVSATVCVENGEIKVSDGATLNAANSYTNPTGPTDPANPRYSYYSRAISGSSSKPCALTVTGENSCVIAETDNSLGKAYGHVNFSIDGAKIEVGTSSPAQTITDINNIKNYKYAKISVPALQRTSDVLIAKENAVVGQWTTITANSCSGSYYYDAAKKELTLKGVNIIGVKNTNNIIKAIHFTKDGTYTIKLEGANTISGNVSTGISAENLYGTSGAAVNVILSGSGSLDISANAYAIEVPKGDLTFNGTGNITLTTNHNYVNPRNALYVAGSVTIDTTKYDITGEKPVVNPTTENLNGNPNLDTILKGTSTNTDLYFKTITITPAAAKPSTISYDGTTLKQGETIKDGKGGTATVATKGNTITLNNFKGTKALSFDATLADSTLVLEGTNTLSSIVTTQKGLTISGSGSLTVGSIRVTNNYNKHADLTITDSAKVTAGTTTSDAKAIDITGNLTVNSGATLTATNTSETNPTIDVTDNVTISGDPGTNAYTVSAHNSCDVQKDRVGHLSASGVPSAIKIGGTLNISAGARVMAQTDSYGAGVMLGQNSTVTVEDAFLSAKNSSCDFAAISFSGYMGDIYVSGENGKVVAENTHTNIGQSLALKAINAFVYNRNTDFYLKMQSEGVIDEAKNKIIAPGEYDASGGKKVTITRGDAYTTPQVAANYKIAGQTMYVGKYYKTDASGNITEGTAQDYNIFCDSENDFTLNNATISSTGTDVAINTNIRYETNVQHHIKLIGTNRINNTFKHAISGGSRSSTIIIESARNASDASLTINGNFLPIYSDGKVIINAEVVIVNTTDDNSFKGLISTSDGKGAFDLGSGYKCYASTSTTGTPLEEFNSANYGTYKYLCVTTKTLETGGGSTHEHVWDEAWHDTGDYHHAHQCTICKAYDTTTQEPHNVTGHRDNLDGSHSNICGSCGYSAKVSHSYTWAPNANDNEKHIGTCVCGNVVERYHNFVGDVCSDCGYDKSTGTTCEHVWTTEWTIDTVDNEYHWHKCIKCNAITDKKPHAYTIVTDSGTNHIRECECKVFYVEDHISSDWIIDTPATATTAGSMHKECTVCKHKMQTEVIPATGEIEPPTPDNPGTIVIIRPAEEEKPAQQPNPSTGANDLVGLAVAAAVAAALCSAALLRKHD